MPNTPQIVLVGYSLGQTSYMPLRLWQNTPHVRDDFTKVLGAHELKLGGEFLNLHTDVNWSTFKYGQIDGILGRLSASHSRRSSRCGTIRRPGTSTRSRRLP